MSSQHYPSYTEEEINQMLRTANLHQGSYEIREVSQLSFCPLCGEKTKATQDKSKEYRECPDHGNLLVKP